MSSKHRRLKPRSANSHSQGRASSGANTASRAVLIFALALLAAFAAVVYAVTRPAPSPRAATNPTKPPAAPNPATPKTPPRPANGPRIEYARAYDFGRAPGDSMVDCTFVLTNAGNAVLEISEVRPGCGCMKTNGWTRQIAPGRTGTVGIRLDTRHYTGNFAKSVFVTCNDPQQTNVMLEVRGYIVRPLEITPPTVVLSLNSETPSNQASVRLVGHLDTPVHVFDPKSSLPNLALELQTNQPGKEYQLLARTVAPFPTASQQGQVTLSTSLSNQPTTNLNVFINYQAVLQAIPYQLRLPAPPLAAAATLNAWVRNNGTNPLAITEAVVNAPGVAVDQKDDPANRGIALTLNFPAGFQAPAGTNLELTVRTSHPLHPLLRIPILQPAATPGATAPR